jgi:hypothetical protein
MQNLCFAVACSVNELGGRTVHSGLALLAATHSVFSSTAAADFRINADA